MPLTLVIRNATQLDNGSPVSLVLDRRGAIIGRAATSDWCLPDPSLHISSRHCEVRYAGDRYELIDHSTNGTFLYGQGARLAGPHVINAGDVFLIGGFEIAAALDEASAAAAASQTSAPPAKEWKGWTDAAGSEAAPPASSSGWGAPPPQSAISGGGPMSQSWAAPSAAAPAAGWDNPSAASASGWASPAPSPASSAWGPAPTASDAPAASGPSVWNTGTSAEALPASDWSTPVSAPPPPSPDDVWGKFAASNVVDWARGGFGTPAPAPVLNPAPVPAPAAAAPQPPQPISNNPQFEASTAKPPAQTAPVTPQPASSGSGNSHLTSFLQAAQVDKERLKTSENEALERAGNLLRRLVSGLVVMLEARARAKSQMGAQSTSLEFDGNNPLKFARSPDQALLQLLNPQERGFMDADRAIEDAFKDLQAHQMATLRAMQGALKATLDRFSPTAIRQRAEQGGVLSKILPGAREAALWKAYEKEFGGVAHGSDEAFMDMFAKEFRHAYDEISRK